MTRAQVEAKLNDLPPAQRRMVLALLGGEKTAVQLVEHYCISPSQQLSKSRRFHGIPVRSAKVRGTQYNRYWLELDAEESAA